MKKYFIFALTIILTTLIVLADDAKFAYALKNCSSYSESGSVQTDGINVTSSKKILGWQGDKCVYQEKLNFSGVDSCVTCKLSKMQIDELVNVMQSYAVVQQYSKSKVDTSNLSAVQDNPVVKAWSKYLQDSSVCTISTNKK